MRELGWTMAQVSRVPETWSDAEARAFAIADNRTSDLATWDYEELVAGLTTVGDADLIRAAGYTPEEYDDLLARLQEGAVGPGGVRTTPSLEEYGERYADKATRLLVCEFRNATYIWLREARRADYGAGGQRQRRRHHPTPRRAIRGDAAVIDFAVLPRPRVLSHDDAGEYAARSPRRASPTSRTRR